MRVIQVKILCTGMGLRKSIITFITSETSITDKISFKTELAKIIKSYKTCVIEKHFKYDVWAVNIFKSHLTIIANTADIDKVIPHVIIIKQMIWSILKDKSFIIRSLIENNVINPVDKLLEYYYKDINFPRHDKVMNNSAFWDDLVKLVIDHNIFITENITGKHLMNGLRGISCPIIKVRNISSFSLMALLLTRGILELHWAIDIERGASFVTKNGYPIKAKMLVSSSSQARFRTIQQSLINDVNALIKRYNL